MFGLKNISEPTKKRKIITQIIFDIYFLLYEYTNTIQNFSDNIVIIKINNEIIFSIPSLININQ